MWDFIRQLVVRSSVLKTDRAEKPFLSLVIRSFADVAAMKSGPRLIPLHTHTVTHMHIPITIGVVILSATFYIIIVDIVVAIVGSTFRRRRRRWSATSPSAQAGG